MPMDDRRHTCRALGDREGCLACQAVNLRMGNPDPDAPHLSATLEALPGFLALLPVPQVAP